MDLDEYISEKKYNFFKKYLQKVLTIYNVCVII
nr:MAG TPA: hypothetical protein [Caudoviricetes sp.]